jgi:MYXO-CTERM domain-containing protein
MTPPPGTVPLPVPAVDAGMVAMDAAVSDAGAADGGSMDAGRDPFAINMGGGGDCACAVPGAAPVGGAQGWLSLGALGLWVARRRRRRS